MIPQKLQKQLALAGKLEEFNQRLLTLESTGIKHREAKAQALSEVGPLPSLRSAPRPRKPKESGSLDSPASLRDAVAWVFENMGRLEVQEHQAPSSAAWTMLEWARKEKSEFYLKYFPRMVPTKALEQGVDHTDDNRILKMIGRIKDAAIKANGLTQNKPTLSPQPSLHGS